MNNGQSVAPLPVPSTAMVRQGILLRAAEERDQNWLRELYCTARFDELAPLPWADTAKRAFLNDQFRLQHLHYQRAYPHADRLIVARQESDGGHVDIGRLYLDRSLRPWRLVEITLTPASSGHGVGSLLMRWIAAAAGAAKIDAIDLHVARDNNRARRFYERLGYREVASLSATHHRMAIKLKP
ncbi:MAG: GNAT family N-acetyltransferase [Sphingopyxis sp.]|uniref:GNAT family N-acetyltransferase n=1 Tax=Sphingopyxis sp. TaxID=1908224 RepID=UPI002AB9489C|nr:GNAT family N-acetyltransferase [Sphingopyxis sp.]MDZ3832822.1 GNAT family N-acetyltransferase [Sphingopyxis sp.]